MTIQRLYIDTGAQTAADFNSQVNLPVLGLDAVNSFVDYMSALTGGNQMANLTFNVAMVKATGTFTFVSVIATDVLSINGVDFTCVASGATGNQFNVGGTDTLTAVAAAAAINASASALVSGQAGVVATSALGVVTLTAKQPGTAGNTITISTPDTTITPSGARLTGGTDGTAYSIPLS